MELLLLRHIYEVYEETTLNTEELDNCQQLESGVLNGLFSFGTSRLTLLMLVTMRFMMFMRELHQEGCQRIC